MSHVRRTRLKQTKRFRCRDDVIYFFSSDNSIKYVNFDLITTHEYQKFMTSIGDDNTYTRFTIKSNLISIQTKGIHLFFVRFINQIIIFIADNYGLLKFFFRATAVHSNANKVRQQQTNIQIKQKYQYCAESEIIWRSWIANDKL